MRIGLDVDDTLTDRENYVAPIVLDYFKRTGKNFKLVDATKGSAIEMFNWTENDFVEFVEKEGYEYLAGVPAKQNAVEVVNKLKQEGHEIIIITARRMLDPYAITKEWLDKHGFMVDEIIVDASDKTAICKHKKIDVFLDDTASIIEDLNKNGIPAFVMEAHYNKNIPTTSPVIKNFKEFYQVVQKLTQEKQEKK